MYYSFSFVEKVNSISFSPFLRLKLKLISFFKSRVATTISTAVGVFTCPSKLMISFIFNSS